MLIRVWKTGYEPSRLDELQDFADTVSAPMFRSLDGCLGFIYAHGEGTWVTYTFWETHDAITAAEQTEFYTATVEKILAAGYLTGNQTTTVLEVAQLEPPSQP